MLVFVGVITEQWTDSGCRLISCVAGFSRLQCITVVRCSVELYQLSHLLTRHRRL